MILWLMQPCVAKNRPVSNLGKTMSRGIRYNGTRDKFTDRFLARTRVYFAKNGLLSDEFGYESDLLPLPSSNRQVHCRNLPLVLVTQATHFVHRTQGRV